jgi:hypothetical protein
MLLTDQLANRFCVKVKLPDASPWDCQPSEAFPISIRSPDMISAQLLVTAAHDGTVQHDRGATFQLANREGPKRVC